MSIAAPVIIGVAGAAVALALRARWLTAVRADFIRTYSLPKGLYDRLIKRRPELSLKDCQLAGQALRQFFLAYLKSGRGFVSMPSQLADDLWHEFILYTKNYDHFCRRAFGRFLHHTPAAVLGQDAASNAGLRRVWWHACREENINPRRPTRLPLLFALDAKLKIADGFFYAPDCRALQEPGVRSPDGRIVHCGGDFAMAGGDGSVDGFGGSDSDSGSGHGHGCSGHGCSSGCSGGSCGGGCGGGGD